MLAKSMISRNFLGFANKKTRVFKYTNESRKKYDAPDIRIRRPGPGSPVCADYLFSGGILTGAKPSGGVIADGSKPSGGAILKPSCPPFISKPSGWAIMPPLPIMSWDVPVMFEVTSMVLDVPETEDASIRPLKVFLPRMSASVMKV